MSKRVSIVGASGYVGGELMRLIHLHPNVHIHQATSRSNAGRYVHEAHPNLRQVVSLRFSAVEDLAACDILFLALPHGEAAASMDEFASLAAAVIDCSADFRLRRASSYEHWYGKPHPSAQWLDRFVYGLPERHRDSLAATDFCSGVGCNAAAVILALGPLADAGVLDRVHAEVKVGSSEGGTKHNLASHHPERSGAVRVYSPYGHRHLAEIEQALGEVPVHIAITAIEMVRGIHLTAHCSLREGTFEHERDVWQLYRQAYRHEPFIRLVASRRGLHRYPEPKVVIGSNYCDIGFALEESGDQLVVMAAMDNLMKGAAGSAVQSMNLMQGWPEDMGLTFPGLHPI